MILIDNELKPISKAELKLQLRELLKSQFMSKHLEERQFSPDVEETVELLTLDQELELWLDICVAIVMHNKSIFIQPLLNIIERQYSIGHFGYLEYLYATYVTDEFEVITKAVAGTLCPVIICRLKDLPVTGTRYCDALTCKIDKLKPDSQYTKTTYGNVPVFCGSSTKRQKYYRNVDFLNIVNSVQYGIEHAVANCAMVFDSDKKFSKRTGILETDYEVNKRKEAFDLLADNIPKILSVVENKNIRIVHQYDTRGRIYPRAFELNYQGLKYQREMLVLKNKQLIEGDW